MRLQSFVDRASFHAMITIETLRRINWTMVLAIPWYCHAEKSTRYSVPTSPIQTLAVIDTFV